MDLGLKGKTVIVTGGGSNIGRGISLTFAGEGSNVVIAELDEKQGQKVADQANALGAGGRCMTVKTDVTKLNEVEALVAKTVKEFGTVDVLVNNVGWDSPQYFVETTPDFWDKVIDLNYRSVLNCIKTVLPVMIEKKSGSIVSVSSDAGRIGEFKEAVYAGCKAAVIGMTKTTAREVGRYGIRVNVACPGTTIPDSEEDIGDGSMWKQEITKIFTPEKLEALAKSAYPLRRLGRPQDLGNAVAFLASDAASFITGQTLSVSGGYSMM